MKTLFFFRKSYLLLLMASFVLLVSCNDDQEDIMQEAPTASLITDVDIFTNSANYTSYLEAGFDIDINAYEEAETDYGKLLLFNVTNSKTRGQNNAAEFIVVDIDKDRYIERTFMLGYKNTPSKDYTGDIQFGFVDNTPEIVNLNFKKGKVLPIEQQNDLLSKMETNGSIADAACDPISIAACFIFTQAEFSFFETIICEISGPLCPAIILAECGRLGCPLDGVEFPL